MFNVSEKKKEEKKKEIYSIHIRKSLLAPFSVLFVRQKSIIKLIA